ncbi:hypothetical protein FSP39_018765 [Pinctada imbricata]|uniref:F-box domain-containing protein n=1 Tax=Pinctada imbricata TaxID=66713 RepID=A0AA89C2B5_PINIB|nr:hypothetical protein FSP39_018765 [Pinctada imbricata]
MPSDVGTSSASSASEKQDGQNEVTKKRSCARQLSSIPNQKYLCQKDSSGFHSSFDSASNDVSGCLIEPQECSEVFSGNYDMDGEDFRRSSGRSSSCRMCHSQNDPGNGHMNGDTSQDSDYLFDGDESLHNGSDNWEECRSPCAIYSWGHFSKCVKNRYKYRRSDYSSDSDDESSSKHNMLNDPKYCNGSTKKKSHLPSCDNLVNFSSVKKDAQKAKSDNYKVHNSRVRDGVKPGVFKEKLATIVRWFAEFNDEQKNMILKRLLKDCDLPQLHLLSVKMEPNLHRGCPPNCQDIITWLPSNIATKIMSYLDPVSLCQAAQVCKVWRYLTEDPSIWRKFCCQQKWRLSKAAEHKQVISHMSQGSIMVWNIRTNAPWSVQTLVGHSGTVRCLHLEGKRLVSGSTDKSIKVWDLSTQESWSSIACKVTMIGHTETVRCLQVDDEKVISGSYDKTLKVWDIRTGQCKMTLRGHLAAVLCVHFNDTKIMSGSCDKTIKVWNYDGACLRTLVGHQDAVTCLQFDSTRIVSGSLDCNLKFWDMHTGACINTIDWKAAEGHTGVVRCLQADSWRLVSAADDKTIKVWNLETGERLVTLRNHTDGVTCLQFNDFIIVSGSYDKTVKLWDFSCC